jgi:hypothetical protein
LRVISFAVKVQRFRLGGDWVTPEQLWFLHGVAPALNVTSSAPGNTRHGTMVGPGHARDMPNLHIPPTGSLEQELVDTAITAGNAGNRIAVISQGPITVGKTPAR